MQNEKKKEKKRSNFLGEALRAAPQIMLIYANFSQGNARFFDKFQAGELTLKKIFTGFLAFRNKKARQGRSRSLTCLN